MASTRPTKAQLARWREDYVAARPVFESLGLRVGGLLRDLFERQGIDVAQVEQRAKSVDSFVEKIRRKAGKYSDPLSEVTDLAALRVVTYTLGDAHRVGELVGDEFEVDHERSVFRHEGPDPDRFGYIAVHYICRVRPPRSELSEWAQFDQMYFEIQVRTVLQHAWSAIDHKLNYKSTTEIPRELQRQLFRVSALLEVADEQFNDVSQQSREVAEEYGVQIERGNLDDLAVDASSLDAYLKSDGLQERWKQAIRDVGATLSEDPALLERDRRDLLSTLNRLEINTIGEFDELLDDAERWGVDVLRVVSTNFQSDNDEPVELNVDEALTLIALYGRLAEDSVITPVLWVDPIPQTLSHLVGEARAPGRRRAGAPARPRAAR